MAERFGHQVRGEEHRRFGEGMGQGLHDPAAERVSRPRAGGERKHQEQIADLGHRRIGDQQFQRRHGSTSRFLARKNARGFAKSIRAPGI